MVGFFYLGQWLVKVRFLRLSKIKIKIMKTIKTIGVLLLSILLQLCLLPIRVVVGVLGGVESTVRIIKDTLTFLIKQISNEVLKSVQHGNENEKQKKRPEGVSGKG